MIRGYVGFFSVLLAGTAIATAAENAAPYAGQETRAIKALSPEEAAGLRSGDGMGFAKAAELNRYPGPRHVLDLAGPLGLDAEQKAATESIYAAMRDSAMAIGAETIEREAELDRLFAEGRADPVEVARLTAAIGVLQARLRAVHLNAHVAQRDVLRAEQIARYDALRGYGGGDGHGLHGGHHP
jgi:hypothetical protein